MSVRFEPLGALCDVRIGRTPRRDSPQFWGGNGVWVTIRELDGTVITDSKEHITDVAVNDVMPEPVPPGTLLFSFKLSIGKMGIAGVPLYTNEAIAALLIRNGEQLDRDYLRYALQASSTDSGANHAVLGKVLNKAKVEALPIPIRSLPDQRRIVDLLSRAEGIVRLRREAQKKAQAIIPALFLDMFGDPATNPKGWDQVSLGTILDEFRYGTSQKSGESGFPTLRIPNVIGDRLDPTEMKFVAVPDAEANRLRLKDGDVLFVRTNGNPDYVGRSAVYESEVMQNAGFDGNSCLYASYLIRARLKRDLINPRYLQSFLSSSEGRRRLREQARTSAGQYNINTEGLSNIKVPLPLIQRQTDFERQCRPLYALHQLQSVATAKATATFQSLLARVFSEDGQQSASLPKEVAVA